MSLLPIRVRRPALRAGGLLSCRGAIVSGATAMSVTPAACSAGSGGAETTVTTGGDVGIEHVHRLGVDPADGVLYAATHFGLWRIPEEGEATRVADR